MKSFYQFVLVLFLTTSQLFSQNAIHEEYASTKVIPIANLSELPDSLKKFATLQTALDNKYLWEVDTKKGGQKYLFFVYTELYKHQNTAFKCNIFDWKRRKVGICNLSKITGTNWYGLNLNEVCKEGEYYILEVIDDNNITKYLRFRITPITVPTINIVAPIEVCKQAPVEVTANITTPITQQLDWYVYYQPSTDINTISPVLTTVVNQSGLYTYTFQAPQQEGKVVFVSAVLRETQQTSVTSNRVNIFVGDCQTPQPTALQPKKEKVFNFNISIRPILRPNEPEIIAK